MCVCVCVWVVCVCVWVCGVVCVCVCMVCVCVGVCVSKKGVSIIYKYQVTLKVQFNHKVLGFTKFGDVQSIFGLCVQS